MSCKKLLTSSEDLRDLPGEIWKPVTEWKGYELQPGYCVSNKGRLKNTGRILTQIGRNGKIVKHPYPACMIRLCNDSDGYLHAAFCCKDKSIRRTVGCRIHQAVATYFLEQKPRPDQTAVNHIDGNKHNNTPENLEWVSPAENNKHARDAGLARLGTSQAKRCKFVEWSTVYSSKTQASLATGHSSSYVFDCETHGSQMKDARTGQLLHLVYLEE